MIPDLWVNSQTYDILPPRWRPIRPGQRFLDQREKEATVIQFLVHEQPDNVGVATVDLKAGEVGRGLYMDTQAPLEVRLRTDVPLGHKLALRNLTVGDTVVKYGHDIGRVTAAIQVGEHVHVHNLKTKRW
jgi:(2R)-sulfolactate sulfo-lyase subunit alpha